ncbi:hypothetical protein U1Q18_044795 [Sarracenia purpurea var. burkii]
MAATTLRDTQPRPESRLSSCPPSVKEGDGQSTLTGYLALPVGMLLTMDLDCGDVHAIILTVRLKPVKFQSLLAKMMTPRQALKKSPSEKMPDVGQDEGPVIVGATACLIHNDEHYTILTVLECDGDGDGSTENAWPLRAASVPASERVFEYKYRLWEQAVAAAFFRPQLIRSRVGQDLTGF